MLGSSRYVNRISQTLVPLIVVRGDDVEVVRELKILGFILQSNLVHELQTTAISNRVNAAISQLKLYRRLLPTKLRERLVQSLILPYIDYSSLLFCGVTRECDHRLQKAFNNAVRFIFHIKPWEHVTPFFSKLRWLKT